MPIQQCSTCGSTPTLYIANGRQFCKAHRADAEALLHPPTITFSARNSDPGQQTTNNNRIHRDHPIGIKYHK